MRYKNVGILLAGGSGTRMQTECPKQFLPLAGKTLLQRTLETFLASPLIDEIGVVLPPDASRWINLSEWKTKITKPIKIIEGGTNRTYSSYHAFLAYCTDNEVKNLIYHDAARALLSLRDLENVMGALELHDGVVLGASVVDTIYELDDSGVIRRIPERSHLWSAQTPQAFRITIFCQAFTLWKEQGESSYSDDVSLVKAMLPDTYIFLLEAKDLNIKITTPTDMLVAASHVSKKS
jgi:2-C-methyl-D-erythritol 4-phosphate cytidylyltransferase